MIAQDTALRDKRRALGRALAAGIEGDDAKIDDELLFIRAIADIDTPHIRLLALMAKNSPPPIADHGIAELVLCGRVRYRVCECLI